MIGPGGIGGYFGARLAKAGASVIFVGRGPHLAAIKNHGLKIISKFGDFHLKEVALAEQISELPKVDLIILAVKRWNDDSIYAQLSTLDLAGTRVMSLQNGMDTFRKTLDVFGPDHALGGVASAGSEIESPGVIHQFGGKASVTFGEPGGSHSRATDELFNLCREAGVSANISEDIEREIWTEFIFRVAFGGVTAALRLPIGPIRDNSWSWSWFLQTINEAISAARQAGVALPSTAEQSAATYAKQLPYDRTSAPLRAVNRGQRLETRWLNGAIVDFADKYNQSAPCNALICACLNAFDGTEVGKPTVKTTDQTPHGDHCVRNH